MLIIAAVSSSGGRPLPRSLPIYGAAYSDGGPIADLDALPVPIWVPVTVHYDGKT